MSIPPTQSAASMIFASEKYPTCCPPVDKLLAGGLSRGHVLEISGPPGTPKESLAISLVRAFVEVGEAVVFVGVYGPFSNNFFVICDVADCQNMTSPATLDKALCSLSNHTRFR